ncbi:MAG TPA: hypothetical protein VFE35_09810 [Candidatus Cybelea sp.]|jgi:hypothetical protein|nr:hypothetical protein [Candidatus Cybelea sp.]
MCHDAGRAATLVAFIAALALASSPIGAAASSNGLAWDSVTKITINADAAALQPGSFDQDYQRAASMQAQDSSGMMAMAERMQAFVQNGFAERHYVAGSKERTDHVADQTATIVDCAARTITTLDLRKKTYRVASMDQPAASNPGAANAGGSKPSTTDDRSRFAITIANKALGAREVGGQPTNGFSSDMSFTETKSSGESQSYNGDLVGYYSSYLSPAPSCSIFNVASPNRNSPPNAAGVFSMMSTGYSRFMRALSLAGKDSRFSLKQTGPALPRDKLALYEAATIGGGRAGGGTIVIERGNVRPISDDDPVFSVPSDFTREQ